MPLAFGAGVNTRVFKLPTGIGWFGVTEPPPSVSVPAVGRLVILTNVNASAGVSLVSVKPKSAALN